MSIPLTLWLIVAGIAIVLAVFCLTWGRGRFGCGCVNDGGPGYPCFVCGFTRCVEHRDDLHNCTKDAT